MQFEGKMSFGLGIKSCLSLSLHSLLLFVEVWYHHHHHHHHHHHYHRPSIVPHKQNLGGQDGGIHTLKELRSTLRKTTGRADRLSHGNSGTSWCKVILIVIRQMGWEIDESSQRA